jgi:hypothetical protein
MQPEKIQFGHLADGREVESWRLASDRLSATILT